jgi:hypothetical protein
MGRRTQRKGWLIMNHSPSLVMFEIWLHPDGMDLPPYVFMEFGDLRTAMNIRDGLSEPARRVARIVRVDRTPVD